MPEEPIYDPDCCYYDSESGKVYRLEYDDHWEPKNFTVTEDGKITFIGNKDDYEIPFQSGGGTILINHEEYVAATSPNPSPEPVSEPSPAPKKRGRPRKIQ